MSSESCGFLSIGARYVREVRKCYQSFYVYLFVSLNISNKWHNVFLLCTQVEPGEIVEITKNGVRTVDIVERPEDRKQSFCIFEYVYFARSDSIFEGQMVYSVRLQCGRQLARESLVDADVVSSGKFKFPNDFALNPNSSSKT